MAVTYPLHDIALGAATLCLLNVGLNFANLILWVVFPKNLSPLFGPFGYHCSAATLCLLRLQCNSTVATAMSRNKSHIPCSKLQLRNSPCITTNWLAITTNPGASRATFFLRQLRCLSAGLWWISGFRDNLCGRCPTIDTFIRPFCHAVPIRNRSPA